MICSDCGLPTERRDRCNTFICKEQRKYRNFYSKTKLENDCLVWTGSKDIKGYGKVNYNGSNMPAHKVAWKLLTGEFPQKDTLNHKCENYSCVRVSHLEDLTFKEHAEFTNRFRRYTCPKGHAKTRRLGGLWVCKVCDRERHRV